MLTYADLCRRRYELLLEYITDRGDAHVPKQEPVLGELGQHPTLTHADVLCERMLTPGVGLGDVPLGA
jgi:hypothetical protein